MRTRFILPILIGMLIQASPVLAADFVTDPSGSFTTATTPQPVTSGPVIPLSQFGNTQPQSGGSNIGGSQPGTNIGGSAGTPSPTTNTNNGTGGAQLVNPLNHINSLPDLLNAILNALIKQIAPVILTVMFVWVGFMFVRAQGNPEQLKKARAALLWTVIGGAILLGAFAIAGVISSTVQGL